MLRWAAPSPEAGGGREVHGTGGNGVAVVAAIGGSATTPGRQRPTSAPRVQPPDGQRPAPPGLLADPGEELERTWRILQGNLTAAAAKEPLQGPRSPAALAAGTERVLSLGSSRGPPPQAKEAQELARIRSALHAHLDTKSLVRAAARPVPPGCGADGRGRAQPTPVDPQAPTPAEAAHRGGGGAGGAGEAHAAGLGKGSRSAEAAYRPLAPLSADNGFQRTAKAPAPNSPLCWELVESELEVKYGDDIYGPGEPDLQPGGTGPGALGAGASPSAAQLDRGRDFVRGTPPRSKLQQTLELSPSELIFSELSRSASCSSGNSLQLRAAKQLADWSTAAGGEHFQRLAPSMSVVEGQSPPWLRKIRPVQRSGRWCAARVECEDKHS